MGGYNSPLLDDYNRTGVISPPLQRAMDIVKTKLAPPVGTTPQPAPMRVLGQDVTPGESPMRVLGQPMEAPPSVGGTASHDPTMDRLLGQTPNPGARPLSNVEQAHQNELNRLTTGETGKSGIDQIHSAWLRYPLKVLGAIEQGFAPRLAAFTPGTDLHHQMLVHQAEDAVANDEKTENSEANRAHLAAETSELGQRGAEEQARAESLANPPEKEEAAGKTITTDQGIFQWNPETKRYDIKAGNAATKEQGTVHQLADGSLVVAHPDGTATAVTLNGQPIKGKTTEPKTPQFTADEAARIRASGGNPDKPETLTESVLRKAHQIGEKPEDHGQNLIDPTTGKLLRVQPGQTVPKGAMTPQQAGTLEVPTSATRTMSETAPRVLELATEVRRLVDSQEKSLGPAASRWGEFMAGKVGAPSAEFTKLRTTAGLLQTALMRMHVGARGGEQIMEHFKDLIDTSKQSPENLRAALDEIMSYAKQVAQEGKSPLGGSQGGSSVDDLVKKYGGK